VEDKFIRITASISDCSPNKEDTFIRFNCTSEIAAQINASRCSCNRPISTSTVQRRLRESGLHGQIAAKKPLLKDNNNKKRLARAKKTRAMDIRPVEICPLVWWVQIWYFWFHLPCLCETQSRWTDDRMISACVVPTMKHGGVMVWGCFSGDTLLFI
jgi:hypothetical protein